MRGRELERKYTLKGISFLTTLKELSDILYSSLKHNIEYVEYGIDRDCYWELDDNTQIRYRSSSDDHSELTLKRMDCSASNDPTGPLSTENRLEWNLDVMGPILEFCVATWGPMCKEIKKSWIRIEMDDETEIALYKVKDDGQQRIFLEIEVKQLDILDRWEKRVEAIFTLQRIHQSLFQLF